MFVAVGPRRVDADQEHAGQGSDAQREGVAGADLRAAPSGRRAGRARPRKQALERLFFSPKRYDLGRVGRYKINQRLGTEHAGRATTVLIEGRLRRDHPLPRRAARGPRPRRRHRPPRQPPHSLGRRADRQPVLGRPVAHGAPGEGAHVDQHRSGEDLARRPRQRAHGVAP